MKSNQYSQNKFSQYEREWNEPSRSIAVRNQSYVLFNKTLVRGFFRRLFACIFQKSCELLSLANIMVNGSPMNGSEIGIKSIPLHKIVGSENRCKDFDNHFTPKSERNHQRWLRISDMFLLGESIPAIELIQVGDYYFVRDGHHRVSVAKAMGRAFIDAKITVYQLAEENMKIQNGYKTAINLSTADVRSI